jgi:hypothetical protein
VLKPPSTAAAVDNGDAPHFSEPKPSKTTNKSKAQARQMQKHHPNRIRTQREPKTPLTNAPMIYNSSTKTQKIEQQLNSAELSPARNQTMQKNTPTTREIHRRCRRKGGRGFYTGGSRVFEGRRRSSWLFWSTTMDFDENEGGLMAVDG